VSAATAELREVGPTVGFLAAILVFGHLCEQAGVFDYLGAVVARGGRKDLRRLLLVVIGTAAGVTAVLTLDATVVLLTPVVVVTAAHLDASPRPFAYACQRIANSGSLLLPVSNLTNLLAFSASGLSFGRFAALAALPWAVACAGEWLTLRRYFADDLAQPPGGTLDERAAPRYALGVLALTVTGFVVTSSLHVSPAWAAIGGCVLLLLPRLPRDVDPVDLVRAASPLFCLGVLALAVAVDEVSRHWLHSVLTHVVPSGSSYASLVAMTVVAAVAANLVNNIPATLVLLPLVDGHPALVLAALVGVNIGPNATYAGSLANVLWRRRLPREVRPSLREFHLLGLMSVPALLVVTTSALWLSVQVLGT
jgi:arsenical pump membrane protein